jgi:hypothetical protein
MKGLLTFYRIISFILLPIAGILGFFGLFALISALANPAFLLGVFMLACIVIYTFTSFSFLSKGITRQLPCKPSLRDWIRVNAFVSLAFAVLSLSQGFTYLGNAAMQKQVLDMGMSMAAQSSAQASFSRQYLSQIMNGTIYFMIFLATVLFIHIFITFRLLRQYKYLFEK